MQFSSEKSFKLSLVQCIFFPMESAIFHACKELFYERFFLWPFFLRNVLIYKQLVLQKAYPGWPSGLRWLPHFCRLHISTLWTHTFCIPFILTSLGLLLGEYWSAMWIQLEGLHALVWWIAWVDIISALPASILSTSGRCWVCLHELCNSAAIK